MKFMVNSKETKEKKLTIHNPAKRTFTMETFPDHTRITTKQDHVLLGSAVELELWITENDFIKGVPPF